MCIIQTNASGTRSIKITEEHLQTIRKYALFQHLADSHGIIDEGVLDRLKLNLRSLIASLEGDTKELLDLCIDVVYHDNMKAYGLDRLMQVYRQWDAGHPVAEDGSGKEDGEPHNVLETTDA